MNPYPSGYYLDAIKECTCSSSTMTKYQKRISGPLLDLIDIHIEVPRAQYEKLSDNRLGESSAYIRARVEVARERQRVRFNGHGGEKMTDILSNADMRPAEGRNYCQLDATGESLMDQPCSSYSFRCERIIGC